MSAGTSQLTTDGTTNGKKPVNGTLPACQTMSVVMSPNGLNAPPALAATTILIQAGTTNAGLPRPMVNATAPITRAVVRLSRMGDITNAMQPVIQNTARNDSR